jgi:acyl-CoA thioesterase
MSSEHGIDPRSVDPAAFGAPAVAADDAQSLAEACGRALWARDHASQALGMRLDEIGPGRALLQMRVRTDMLNGHGSCHGGFVFALADSCFAFACNSHGTVCVAAGCQIEYLAPAHDGELLRAEGVERARSGRSGVYDVRVSNERGETVALMRGRSRRIEGHVTDAAPAT